MDSDEDDEEPKNEPEFLQTLRQLYQYDICIKDQQPVRKNQLQVLILAMKTVNTVMSTVHRVKTLEEQYSVEISTFQLMMNIGQCRLNHTSMPQQPDHFLLLQQKRRSAGPAI